MKIAVVIVRTLMGLLFLFASITYFFELITPPPLTGAMKVFNEGPAETSGQIVAVLVENGTPVEFGQPLFKVNPKK